MEIRKVNVITISIMKYINFKYLTMFKGCKVNNLFINLKMKCLIFFNKKIPKLDLSGLGINFKYMV